MTVSDASPLPCSSFPRPLFVIPAKAGTQRGEGGRETTPFPDPSGFRLGGRTPSSFPQVRSPFVIPALPCSSFPRPLWIRHSREGGNPEGEGGRERTHIPAPLDSGSEAGMTVSDASPLPPSSFPRSLFVIPAPPCSSFPRRREPRGAREGAREPTSPTPLDSGSEAGITVSDA